MVKKPVLSVGKPAFLLNVTMTMCENPEEKIPGRIMSSHHPQLEHECFSGTTVQYFFIIKL